MDLESPGNYVWIYGNANDYPANISTLFQRCLLVGQRGTTSNQHWNNVVYFNVDMNNVRQRRNNAVKMTASKKNKKTPGKIQIGKIQIEFLEFKILATIS